MNKKRTIIILLVFLVTLISLALFYTYAIDVKMDKTTGDADLTFNINITDTNGRTVTVPKRDSKVFDFFLKNDNGGTIRYGLAYSGTKPATVKIAQMSNSKNPVNSTIPNNTTYQVTITIINDSDTEQSFTIAPVTGYQNGGDLIVPSGYTLITDTQLALPQPANSYIISLSKGDSWASGARGVYQTNGHEYRYVGANVNNYVSFNNDLYRIIGVFDDNSHGVTGQKLVKLIAANSIGGYAWGVTNSSPDYTTYSTYNNNWETSNANILLNEYFLNATDTSTIYKSCSDWTYYFDSNDEKTKDCSDIIGYGIQTTNLRNYIQPVTWYLKGYNSSEYSKQNFYTCERSDATTISNCSSGNQGAYATKVENKSIGLMYVSDYLYASSYYAITNTASASKQYYGQQNWLYNRSEWTMTPVGTSSTSAFEVSYGDVSYINTYYPDALRPSFYLKSTIKIKSGSGTFKNPYVIGY